MPYADRSLTLSALETMVRDDRHITRTAEQEIAKPVMVRDQITSTLKRRLEGTGLAI